MRSLPSLKVLNAQAESKGWEKKLDRACRTGVLDGEKLVCEWHDRCEGDLRHYLHYDIFSDKPKGILTLCERHDGYYGSSSEGYFECVDCNKIMVTNENYYTSTSDGDVCIPCYADRVLNDEDAWIPLTDEAIDAINFNNVRKAKHLIAVQMPVPEGIEAVGDGVTFDSMDGHGVNDDIDNLKEELRQAKEQGANRALLILDGGFQFCVSVYVPVKGGRFDQAVTA